MTSNGSTVENSAPEICAAWDACVSSLNELAVSVAVEIVLAGTLVTEVAVGCDLAEGGDVLRDGLCRCWVSLMELKTAEQFPPASGRSVR